jgi:hypothetical protein
MALSYILRNRGGILKWLHVTIFIQENRCGGIAILPDSGTHMPEPVRVQLQLYAMAGYIL